MSCTSVDLPLPETPVTTVSVPSGNSDIDVFQVVLARSFYSRASAIAAPARGRSGDRRASPTDSRPVTNAAFAMICCRTFPARSTLRRVGLRAAPDRSRNPPARSSPHRVRPPAPYCRGRAGDAACRAAVRYRADATRWTVHPIHTARRAASIRSASPNESAALRRPERVADERSRLR